MGSFRPKCNKVHGLREEKCLLRLPSVVLAKITLEPEKGEKKKKKKPNAFECSPSPIYY